MFFYDIKCSYSVTLTQTLTFGYVKGIPDVAFTGSFLDIVFGQYLRQEIEKKNPPKMWNESVIACFCSVISPMGSCPFHEK